MSEEINDAVAIEHETLTRLANLLVTVVPLALLGFAGWLAWGGALHWQDLVVLAITYTLTVIGVTVGYHRLFTHRSFKLRPPGPSARCWRFSDPPPSRAP